ncbi:MAG TPA: alpha/beta hydrolase-fold protein [Acidimicrobiales bacterium]|nr:alpha/beta hydrolase-fold protein [Acidimicrobiales bacterium]
MLRHRLLPVMGATCVALLGLNGAVMARYFNEEATPPVGVEVLHVPSPEKGRGPRDVWVWKPHVRNVRTLPVLYFLHGVPGQAGDVFDHGLAAALAANLARDGTPFIVAAPDGNGTTRLDTEWADAKDGQDLLETFVLKHVIPAVEGPHLRDRRHRAIAGFSMGGYGAMNLALRHPDVFGQVVSMAGYFHVDDPDGMFGKDPAVVAANSPDQHVAVARRLRVLLLSGDHDEESVVTGESQRFKALLDEHHVPATLTITPGGHDWGWVASQFPALIDFLGRPWHNVERADNLPFGMVSRGMKRAGHPL